MQVFGAVSSEKRRRHDRSGRRSRWCPSVGTSMLCKGVGARCVKRNQRDILNGPEARCEVPHAHATGSVGFRAPILLISLALGV